MRIFILSCCAALFGLAAVAQEDPMAVQRCVWACLANNGPATNPAYDACVTQNCGFEEAEGGSGTESSGSAGSGARTAWYDGQIDGGQTTFAGVDTADGAYGVYYFCNASGRSDLMIAGVDGPAGAWAVVIDGQTYAFTFGLVDNGVATQISPQDGVLSALQRGSVVSLTGPGLPNNDVAMRLTGSSRALKSALARCR